MAAVDWFQTDVAAPPVPRAPRPKPRSAPRRRAEGRRLTGGIVWISIFAVLLAGVVAVNVAVLRSNMSLSNLNQQELQLQSENQTLASQVSSAGSSLRIEQAAHRLGLVPAPAADTSYLDLTRPK
jgi:cell division protein FtsL